MQHIPLKDMMAHQAGLPAWIPFYYKTVKGGKLDTVIYSRTQKEGYSTRVMDDIWILDSYADTIYKRILKSKLQEKSYKYSDLGYYFVKKIVEKITQLPYDKFLQDSIYKPMGLNKITYNPLAYYDLAEIIPTEQDNTFRGKLVHGYVHDPGAAMLGGVGGHAGLFATATDLGSLMHLFMNKGNYGGIQYLSPDVVEKYTSCQFCTTNRRGIGFDRPTKNGGGTCDKVCSQSSYGHSGFTGTLAWNDPKYEITYVFLSNRVYPDAENWKIVKENIRTNIQRVIYDAITASQLRQ
jgi:CubicO group peptidase (beta-lactamase class C family)